MNSGVAVGGPADGQTISANAKQIIIPVVSYPPSMGFSSTAYRLGEIVIHDGGTLQFWIHDDLMYGQAVQKVFERYGDRVKQATEQPAAGQPESARIQELLEANSRYVQERQEARNRAEGAEALANKIMDDTVALMMEFDEPGAPGKGFMAWMRGELEELKIRRSQGDESGYAKIRDDRDRLSATISEIRKILIAEGCGGHDTSTTDLAKAAASFVNRCGPVGTFERISAITDALTKILHPSSMPVTGTPKHVLDVLETAVGDVGRLLKGFQRVKDTAKAGGEMAEKLYDTAKAGAEAGLKAFNQGISCAERFTEMERRIRDQQRQLENIRARMEEDRRAGQLRR